MSCTLDRPEACSLSSLIGPTDILVPSEKCHAGNPYKFLVRPGRADALLVYFQHDGICIPKSIQSGQRVEACDRNSAARNLNLNNTHSSSQSLIASRSASALRDGLTELLEGHTILEVQGCTGDAYSGSRESQHGYRNTKAALQWARKMRHLRDLVVAGDASGAWGAAIWASTILDTFEYDTATVVMSAFPYQLSLSTAAYLYAAWGTCATSLLGVAECENGYTREALKRAIATHDARDARDAQDARGKSTFFAVIQSMNDDFSVEVCDLAAQSLNIFGNSYCKTAGSSHVVLSLSHWVRLRNFAFHLSSGTWPESSWLTSVLSHTARSICTGTSLCLALTAFEGLEGLESLEAHAALLDTSTTRGASTLQGALTIESSVDMSSGALRDASSAILSVPKVLAQSAGLSSFLGKAELTNTQLTRRQHAYFHDEALGFLVGLAILTVLALVLVYICLGHRRYEAVTRSP